MFCFGLQAEAEYEILSRTTAEEKLARSNRMNELQREEERIASERNKLEREKAQLEMEQDKLAKQARQIREQSEQIDHVTEVCWLGKYAWFGTGISSYFFVVVLGHELEYTGSF